MRRHRWWVHASSRYVYTVHLAVGGRQRCELGPCALPFSSLGAAAAVRHWTCLAVHTLIATTTSSPYTYPPCLPPCPPGVFNGAAKGIGGWSKSAPTYRFKDGGVYNCKKKCTKASDFVFEPTIYDPETGASLCLAVMACAAVEGRPAGLPACSCCHSCFNACSESCAVVA